MTGAVESDRLARGRATVEESAEGLRIVIPALRNWFVLAFLAVWLAGWAFGEVTVAATLLGLTDAADTPDESTAFMLVWLTAWTLAGGLAFFVLAWGLFGREEVRVGGGRLVVARRLGRLRRERSFDTARVEELRADGERTSRFDPRASLQAWGLGGGAVAFDYGMRTHHFGASLDEAEARHVARRLQEALR